MSESPTETARQHIADIQERIEFVERMHLMHVDYVRKFDAQRQALVAEKEQWANALRHLEGITYGSQEEKDEDPSDWYEPEAWRETE